MADTKISALTAVTTGTSADAFAVVQGGVTKKITTGVLTSIMTSTNLGITGSTAAVHVNITGSLTGASIIAGNAFTGTHAAASTQILTIKGGIIISSA